MKKLFFALSLVFTLSACDQIQHKLGLVDPAAKAAQQAGEGTAVGAACRQSGRAIEDCYAIYHWLPKAAIFSGWQEMDTYMRTNKIETVEPQLPPPGAPGVKRKPVMAEPATAEKESSKTDKPAEAETKKADKH